MITMTTETAIQCSREAESHAGALRKDATASTKGFWVYTSDVAGRADATLAAPPGGGIPELDIHMREIGHCIESKGADTDVLAKAVLHFN